MSVCGTATTNNCCCCRCRRWRRRSKSARTSREAAASAAPPSARRSRASRWQRCPTIRQSCSSSCRTWPAPAPSSASTASRAARCRPRRMIRSIRISRDQFAAEYHSAGGVVDRHHHAAGPRAGCSTSEFRARGSAFDGTQPVHAELAGPEQNLNFGFGMVGALIKNKSVVQPERLRHRLLRHAEPQRRAARAARAPRRDAVRAPRDNLLNVNAQMDYAITLDPDAALRLQHQHASQRKPRASAATTKTERAFTIDNRVHNRAACSRSDPSGGARSSDHDCCIRGPTWSGSRQPKRSPFGCTTRSRAAARRWRAASVSKTFNAADRIWTTCAACTPGAPASALDGGWHHSDDTSNYLGTYTFESLDAFPQNRPRSFTAAHRRSEHRLSHVQGARLRAGRHPRAQEPDAQPGRALRSADARRATTTTSGRASASRGRRSASGKTTLRASAGIFYDWLQHRHLRADAARRRRPPAGAEHPEPLVPRPGALRHRGVVPPTNRYLLGSELRVAAA